MSVPSTCSMRVRHMEGTASSQRRLCSPSGPKRTKSNFSTHHGNFHDLGWPIDGCINTVRDRDRDRLGFLVKCQKAPDLDDPEEQKHITRLSKLKSFISESENVRYEFFIATHQSFYWSRFSMRWLEHWKISKYELIYAVSFLLSIFFYQA